MNSEDFCTYAYARETLSGFPSTSTPCASPLTPPPSALDGYAGHLDRWGSFDESHLINIAACHCDGFWGQSASSVLPSAGFLDGVVDTGCPNIHQPADWESDPISAIFPDFCPLGDSHFLDSPPPLQFAPNISATTWEESFLPSPVDSAPDDERRLPAIIFIPPSDETPQDARPSQLKKRSLAQASRGRQTDGVPYPEPPTHSADEQPVRRKRLKKANNQQQQQQQQIRRFRLHQGEAETQKLMRFEGNWTDDRLSSGVSPFERDDGLTPNGVRSGGRASGGVKRKRRARGSKMISMDDQITSTNLESTASNVVDTMEEAARRKSQASTQQRFGSYTTGLVFRQTCFNADGSKNTIYS